MLSNGKDDVTIREYLLGKLSDEDREEFERRYFSDDDLFDKLPAAEEELIDDFLIGNLSQADVDMFRRNFLVGHKRERQRQIGKAWRDYAAAHVRNKPPKPVPDPNWWQLLLHYAPRAGAVAGLIVVAVIGIRYFIPEPKASEVTKALDALNAAYKQERPLQSRITKFDYAPYNSNRGSAGPANVDENQLNEAKASLLSIVNKTPTSEAHHALGQVFLSEKKFDKAIEQFELALKGDANNAKIYSDLGTALLEKGKFEIERSKSDGAQSGKGVQSFNGSLNNLNKALQLDPDLLEALYNRALLHQAMTDLPKAEEDWRKYLQKDPNSKWADDARTKLTDIEQQRKSTSETGGKIFQRFLDELNSRDEEAVWTTVSNYQNRTGNVAIEPLIDTYLEAASQNRKEEADLAMKRLAYVGDLQRRKSGDAFFLT